MTLFKSASVAILAAIAFGTPAQAVGTSGVDTSFVDFVNISSTSPSAPTVVNTVIVKCPSAGLLISAATAQITMGTFNGQADEADVIYSITKNSTAQDINKQHTLREYTSSGTAFAAASSQRFDTCTAGQTLTFRFVVHRLSATSASAEKSGLVVTFIQGARV